MFTDFFFGLKKNKVPVSVTEWLTFMKALAQGLHFSDLNGFYHVARAILVKNEAHFDLFDQVFAAYFKDLPMPEGLEEKILDWLKKPIEKRELTAEEKTLIEQYDLEELRRLFEERLKEQTERHDGGNRWIGTGGTSPFGHGGYHPGGIRVGGQGGSRSAVQVASERRFRNYRHDITLDVRQMQVSLKKLRQWIQEGPEDELDLEGTIDKTCRNGGDIDLVFRRPRKNDVKILLLMDVGGTMDPYADLVSQLFSAAHQATHFKDFRYYYFHNCVYQNVYKDMWRRDKVPTGDLFRLYNENYRLIMVGDAYMAPYELLSPFGAIDYYDQNRLPGVEWLHKLQRHFRKSIWLNPEPAEYWAGETTAMIRQIFSMYTLTLDGLDEAVHDLKH
jgi:uncharacterized protein